MGWRIDFIVEVFVDTAYDGLRGAWRGLRRMLGFAAAKDARKDCADRVDSSPESP